MSPSNIEAEIRHILEKNNGCLRKEQCAKQYARDPISGDTDGTKRTRFYRWSRQVETHKVKGFQIIKKPGNISIIGLENADPKFIENIIGDDEKILDSVKRHLGFFDRLDGRAERQQLERKAVPKEWLAHQWNAAEGLADLYPKTFGFLKDMVKTEKKNLKETGLMLDAEKEKNEDSH